MQNIMKPKININGTDKQALIDMRMDARDALGKTIQAMGEMRPHGRDYQGFPDEYKKDFAIHQERMASLNKLYNDIELEIIELWRE